ncbi:hypothetical protein PF008_g7108 [Phytophthora fragariae]|uniref:Uncharacterized protein n=1 Tax=Phytophthora fragariae TaxID=53985 RepID=A0A6G0S433_9STRA|nr:hypothetical protein PF008_g7108 [Phytophthora fragariae]
MPNKHKSGFICTFPECNMTLTTSKFKQHFTRHLKEGERYEVSHRDRYERALDDASLLSDEDGEGANAYLVAQLRTILAHVQAVDTRLGGMETRMASIEELLRARPANQDRQESVAKAIEESSSSEEESSSDEDADVEMVAPTETHSADAASPNTRKAQRRVLRALRQLS